MATNVRFYKGEDIHLTLGAYRDEALEEVGCFEGYGVDVLLYTSDDESHIALSSEAGDEATEWKPLTRNDDGTLEATLSKAWTEELDPGLVRIEIRLTNRATGEAFIAARTAFQLVESRIASLAPCMQK